MLDEMSLYILEPVGFIRSTAEGRKRRPDRDRKVCRTRGWRSNRNLPRPS